MIDRNLDMKLRIRRLGLTQEQFSKMVGLPYEAVREILCEKELSHFRWQRWNEILDDYVLSQMEAEPKGENERISNG